MEFNRYLWDLYALSAAGQAALSRPPESLGEFDTQLAEWQVQTFRPSADGGGIEPIEDDFASANIFDDVNLCVAFKKPNSPRAANELFEAMIDEGLLILPDEANEDRFYIHGATGFEEELYSNIDVFSLALFKVIPNYFAPLFYGGKFDRFVSLCDFFGIAIPPPPGKNKKRERACYYLRINEALQEFRRRHGLTPTELVAFLYDFAPRMMASQEDRELPPPSKVWFTMGGVGGNGDFEFLDNAGPDSVTRWQGNPDTRRGDVILMWCVSPRSYLHSVWRAIDDGFVDPFFYFYSAIRIGGCVKIPHVPFKEFMADPRLKLNPFVKSHFQGAGGKPFPLEDYVRVLEILAGKGFEVSNLPVPPRHAFILGDRIQCERDVEVQLVEPLLLRLGYMADHWLRQMPIRMGRGERNYPDYAILPVTTRGEESAHFLIEAKLTIATRKQFDDAYLQGKSVTGHQGT